MKTSLFVTLASLLSLALHTAPCSASEENPMLAPQSDSVATQIHMPAGFSAAVPEQIGPNVKRLTFDNLTYVGAWNFTGCDKIEEIVFKGTVFHTDGYVFKECPQLRRIVFEGPVVSTGGPVYAISCPNLKEVVFNDLVLTMNLSQTQDCPMFEGYKINGKVIHSDSAPTSPITPSDSCSLFKMEECLRGVLDGPCDNEISEFLIKLAYNCTPYLSKALDKAGLSQRAHSLAEYYYNYENPVLLSKLDILKLSEPYNRDGQKRSRFVYTHRSDSLLTATREYFNLDSIAGRGDDISRIKNITVWLHDLIRHDGSSSWPDCHYNAPALYEVCKKENRGLNCRFLAMMLTECLLAEGIPARYLTCQSKEYRTDTDCHVICMAWSRSLSKWVWADPSFAAFVYDENGVMLHPGEVRERLQTGSRLQVNEDANWNHENPVTIDEYLENYMAKNLYILECNIVNKGEAEGKYAQGSRETVCLVPDGFQYHGQSTTDDEYFWQPPQRPKRMKQGK